MCIRDRIITADVGFRRGNTINLKEIVDEAVDNLDFVKHIVVLKRKDDLPPLGIKDKLWHELMKNAPEECKA